jgi:hypothetical protein
MNSGMRQSSKTLLVLFVFFLGCAASQVAGSFVPAAHAGTDVQHWEYACKRGTEGITEMANEMGRQGWEMTAAAGAGWGNGLATDHTMVWCFKRPLP